MPTGDPWCPVHGYTPCRCRELQLIAFGVGVGKSVYWENQMSGNFTVLTPEQEERLNKLEAFYREIRRLANSSNLNEYPLVYQALSKVDPKWNEGSN